MQPNPELPEAGGVKLAANEKEVLLLELFPMVAKTFLTDQKKKPTKRRQPKTLRKLPPGANTSRSQSHHGPQGDRSPAGQDHRLKVKVGDKVKAGQEVVILEAMKMENEICAPQDGTVATVECAVGDSVETGKVLVSMN